MLHCRFSLLPVIALVLGGCALAPVAPLPLSTTVAANTSDCLNRYRRLDTAIDQAGVRDAGASRINGFPYLRVNRLLASYRDQPLRGQALQTWLQAMAKLDLQARAVELANLGADQLPERLQVLQQCSQRLEARDLASPERLALLRQRALVPSDYSSMQRMAGLYPLALPFLKKGVERYQQGRRDAFAQPLSAQGKLLIWRPGFNRPGLPAGTIATWLQNRDALGRPQLSQTQWRQLTQQFAPSFWLDSNSRNDVPGTPYFLGSGQPAVEPGQARVYFYHHLMRWQGQLLPQLVYVVWFAARTAISAADPYAGQLDGLMWRVTLGSDGKVLTYDSVHPCGCYHSWFPVAALQLRQAPDKDVEPPLVLQRDAPASDVAVRLRPGSHLVHRVVPASQASGTTFSYILEPYRQLLTLAWPGGGTRSLFGPYGIVAGSQRLERYWLWPSGVVSPGAMRQRGRHAIAFVGQRFFDDPQLLETVFRP